MTTNELSETYKKGYIDRGISELTNSDNIILHRHVTSGGAIYLTDNHNFSKATIVIRLDGGAELIRCDVK
jgi:hypothetical protein